MSTTTSSRASEAELLPCPFCGDKPSTYDASIDRGDGRWSTHTHVRCPTCETEQTSVEDWNTRAALSAVPPQGQGQEGVYRTLREANVARQAAWCPEQIPDLSFRGVELAGEVGEVCNVIKKLERERLGWRGSRDTVEHLAEELADVVICADLAAMAAGIDLDAAIVAKFNATSEKVGLPQRLSCLTDTPKPGVSADDLADARAKIEHLCGSWNALVGVIEAACDDLSIPYGGFNGAPAHMVQRIAERAAEVTEIRGMLLAGQGDDDGARILPDLGRRMSTPAMVAECIALLEKRRDVIEAPSTSEMDACERAWNEGYDAALAAASLSVPATEKEAGGTWLQDRLYAAGNDTSLPARIRALLKGAAYRIESDAKEAE